MRCSHSYIVAFLLIAALVPADPVWSDLPVRWEL